MDITPKSLGTKLGRRIFALFIICAIVPVSALAIVSFVHVKSQLSEQSENRLRQETKTLAASFYERLLLLRTELWIVSSHVKYYSPDFTNPSLPRGFEQDLKARFRGLAIHSREGTYRNLFGRLANRPDLKEPVMGPLSSGKAFLHWEDSSESPAIFLSVAIVPKRPEKGLLTAEIKRSYLMKVAEGRPPHSEVIILDENTRVLFSTLEGPCSFPKSSLKRMLGSHSGQFDWQQGDKAYLARYSSIFLESNFLAPKWIVILGTNKSYLFAIVNEFKKFYPVIAFLSLAMVFFLSINLIRKNTVPIKSLQEATEKVAQGAYGYTVNIKSGDEFENLGESFNEMSKKLKENQALLVHAAKMSVMGQMAAGVMHELKQPLTAIHMNLNLSLADEPSGKSRERLVRALEAVERLNAILQRFNSFSSVSEEKFENVSITSELDKVYRLMEHQLNKAGVRCELVFDEDVPPIFGDRNELQQVFSNLFINSLHALEYEQDKDRRIIIRVHKSRDSLTVEFEDTGCGIAEEHLERIFDPFFTTKGSDKGNGLGMAIIDSILHNHRAKIDVKSEVGEGTKFILNFPISAQQQ